MILPCRIKSWCWKLIFHRYYFQVSWLSWMFDLRDHLSIIHVVFCGNRLSNDAPSWHNFACSLKKEDVGYRGKLSGEGRVGCWLEAQGEKGEDQCILLSFPLVQCFMAKPTQYIYWFYREIFSTPFNLAFHCSQLWLYCPHLCFCFSFNFLHQFCITHYIHYNNKNLPFIWYQSLSHSLLDTHTHYLSLSPSFSLTLFIFCASFLFVTISLSHTHRHTHTHTISYIMSLLLFCFSLSLSLSLSLYCMYWE